MPKCSHHLDESMVAPVFKDITIWAFSLALCHLVTWPPADPLHSLPGLSAHLPKADSKTFYTETTEGFAPTTVLNNKVTTVSSIPLISFSCQSLAYWWYNLANSTPKRPWKRSLLFLVFLGVHTERKYQTPLILPKLRSPYWSHVHFWFLQPLLIK